MNPSWFLTNGQRFSLFSRMDFRTKLWVIVVFSLVAFLWDNTLLNVLLVVVIIGISLLAGVRFRYFRLVLTIMLPFCLFIILTHGFFNTTQVKELSGRNTLTMLLPFPRNWGILSGYGLTWEGMLYGINIAAKMMTMTLVLPLGVFTTEIDAMMVSLVKLKIPYRFVFIFSSAMRFFPLLASEITEIREAQKLRGLDMRELPWLKRIQVYGGMAVPLILGAMVKSQKLEIVLQSRVFTGSSGRTYLHTAEMDWLDYGVIILFFIFFIVSIGIYFLYGIGKFVV